MKEYIYSRNAVLETLRANRRDHFQLQIAEGVHENEKVLEILKVAKHGKIPITRSLRATMDKIHPNHQGVILQVSGYPYADLLDIIELADSRQQSLFILLIDSLNDPQNFGALLRTSEAVGIHGVILPLAHSVEVTPAVVNASSGASEHLLITRANLSQAIDQLRQADTWIVGLDEHGETYNQGQTNRLEGNLGLVVGSEGNGIRPLIRSKCDFLLRLPMTGKIESLNAAVAGSVVLYLACLVRGKKPSSSSSSGVK